MMLTPKEISITGLKSLIDNSKSVIEDLTYKNISYQRIKKNFRGFNYGEIILDYRIVPQYPPIYRCYNFKKALYNHFHESEKFLVEEKLDGYNVRIIYFADQILCFTRGGFVCPYTSEIIDNYPEIRQFLIDHPDKVVCAEMVGENPYNTLSTRMYGPEPRLFVFDIMNMKDFDCKSRKRKFLISPFDKLVFYQNYEFNSVPILGEFTPKDYKELRNLILKLNEEKKEGIVIKSLDKNKKYIKYATPYADIEAITDHITKSFECDTAHFRKRLFLIASYLLEFSIDQEKTLSFLNNKLFSSLVDILKENKKIEEYNLTISEENWTELEKLLTRTLKINIVSEYILENGKKRIKFEKYYKKTSEFIRGANAGKLFID